MLARWFHNGFTIFLVGFTIRFYGEFHDGSRHEQGFIRGINFTMGMGFIMGMSFMMRMSFTLGMGFMMGIRFTLGVGFRMGMSF